MTTKSALPQFAFFWHSSRRMDAPDPTPAPLPSPQRRFSRRTLFKLAGGAITLGLGAEFLRVVALTNVHTVIPGRVYRTAQLKPQQLHSFIAEKGIRTVVNLRGTCADMLWYRGECQITHTANINQEDITFSAKRFPAPTEIQRLIDVLDHTAYPIVFHCQRGADRTGLASTVARLLFTSDELSVARRQLWPRYGHVPVGRTAVLDSFFDYYQKWLAARGETHSSERFRSWVQTDYCPGPYRAQLSFRSETKFAANRGFTVSVKAVNTSVEPWRFLPSGRGGIQLRYILTTTDGAIVHIAQVGRFARVVQPGEAIEFICGVPPLASGSYTFVADLLDAEPIELLNTSFVQHGSEPLETRLIVV